MMKKTDCEKYFPVVFSGLFLRFKCLKMKVNKIQQKGEERV